MKKSDQWFLTVLIAFFFVGKAEAYKYVIVTDQADPKKSEEIVALLKETYPFNTYSAEFEILKVDSTKLKCDSQYDIERNVGCQNSDEILTMAQKRGADQTMVVKDLPKHGGSAAVGGGIPVITSGTDAKVMLHEYLHTLGLCDEYKFKASETNLYCTAPGRPPNVAYFEPLNYYVNDRDARNKHVFDIPWYKSILSSTPITNSGGKVLGTGDVNDKALASNNTSLIPLALKELVGLYKAGVCDNATPKRTTWIPEGNVTIMNDYKAGLGSYTEKKVDEILLSKGLKKKLDNEVPRDAEIVDHGLVDPPPATVVVNARPDRTVNDSSRGFFKSFFSWVSDFIRSIGNAITR